ncbi:hypothetical protein EYM_07365 [Ignicoccus islandicus DSM 13165]|uniref:Uncharacterized protein n=1 Tax=Ignicoccus islandicus DSM 13165 TaxID=940295 RepID=A0A0U3FLP6_9CREN|nr:hypothetical protein EYM_07365 [Ignicoccus islandicus DSM 13165]
MRTCQLAYEARSSRFPGNPWKWKGVGGTFYGSLEESYISYHMRLDPAL